MPEFQPFSMERWQSTWENHVDCNLSESGVAPLTVGALLELAEAALDDVVLGYGHSRGSDPLRAAIAARYPGADPAGVLVATGSAEANFLACWELVEPGDTVAVVLPTYMQTPGLAGNFGARVVALPLREELGWQPDPDEVRRLLQGRVRLLVITNPNNPTGAILAPSARQALLDGAERTGAWILADEVYTGAELDGRETASCFGGAERVIATSSLSKAYGLPGLRTGWAVTTPAMAERLWARKDYTTISGGPLTDRLAALALGDVIRPRLTARARALIRDGLATLEPWLERWGCRWRRPDAGAICYARYPWQLGSAALAERLRSELSVLVVPGAQFGMEGFLRFGVGDPHGLERALTRVNALVSTLDTTSSAA